MPDAMLSVFTLYHDPGAAAEWLHNAFGFKIVNRFEGDDGVVMHAELRLGDAVVIVERAVDGQEAPPVLESSTVRAPVLCLGDEAAVDELYDRVVESGATVIRKPETTAWGNRRFEVLDPEGHQWSVGAYVPGQSW